jgi:dTDP-4-dehydrorhamnose reductase
MNILITGSKGQLGSEFRTLAGNYPEHNFDFTDIEELDLTDFEAVREYFRNHHFDYCVNCAGYTAVDQAEDEPDKAFLLNADAVGNLAKVCKDNGVRLIHISTDYVFDGTATKPYKEEDPLSPQSVYGASKLKGEQLIAANTDDAFIIRTAWLCSVYGKNFVKTIIKLAGERSELNVVNDQWGSPTFTEDLARAILKIIISKPEDKGVRIYHYSSEGKLNWYIFAVEIVKMSGLTCRINPVSTGAYPTKAKRPAYSVLDKSKIKRDFGVEVPDWKTSLQKLINQLKDKRSDD